VKDSKNSFRILSQNIPCGTNGQICSKNILIEYNGVVIDLIRGRSILLNNIELLNYRIQPVTFGNIHIYQLGIYTMIKTNDFTVKWDEQTFVQVSIQSDNEMLGLCGNNNDNFDDDFKTANGASQINVFDMAKSWQTSVQCTSTNNQSINTDPCGDSIEHAKRRTWAASKCDLIKIKSSIVNNPFAICIEKMETSLIEKYYKACLYDACQ
jgi:mucin-5B